MKKLMLALLLLPGVVMSYEIPENPDRMPSFGFHFSRGSSSSEVTLFARGLSFFQEGDSSSNAISLDARIPMNGFFTFNFAVAPTWGSFEAKETKDIAGVKESVNGVYFSFGFRVYMGNILLAK